MVTKKTDPIIKSKDEYAYGHIIKALAGGLYPNKFHVIREYIQNAFDAVISWKDAKEDNNISITISIKKPSIFIYDNGTGMDRHTLNEYRKVGFSKKVMGESAGFRGIGKLAGISVAKKLIVTTSPFGVAEKYTLVFDAASMLQEIDELKRKKANISLNMLIEKYTGLSSEIEDKNKHYTIVELNEIRNDSKILFVKEKLIDYISKNAPVPFDPNFIYGEQIEENIKNFVEDYNCVEILVDDTKVYKPFISNLKMPQFIPIIDSKDKKKLIAYCWYCENQDKGQIQPSDNSGLFYRYKNFAVGNNYLTRTTIWSASPHLAFYFIGEVYIIDSNIIPTSQRDDFEQSTARGKFYDEAKIIATMLNKTAHKSSEVRRAEEYVIKGNEIVSSIDKAIQTKDPSLKDLRVYKIATLVNISNNIKKRQKNIPEEDQKTNDLAKRVLKKANRLLKEIEKVDHHETGEFDIVKKLKLDEKAEQVYITTVRTLKDYFVNKPEELENILKVFQNNLIKAFNK